MTAAAPVSLPDFGLASAVAERAVAVASGLALTFAARCPAAAGLVSAFALAAVVAERVVAVASDLGLIVFSRAPAVVVFFVVAAVFVLVAFLADRVFALPAILSAHRPLC